MKRQPIRRRQARVSLVLEYEAMSQKGTVPFFEKAAYAEIALHYHEHNCPQKARGALEHATALYKASLELRFLSAATHVALQNLEAAKEELELCEILAEDQALADTFRAQAYVSIGAKEKALSWLLHLSNKWMVPPEPMAELDGSNRLFEALHRYTRMFDYYKSLVLMDPDNQAALEQLWLCVELTERYDESIILHESVCDTSPYSSRAWFNLGHAYLNKGRDEDALEAFEFAFLADPSYEAAYTEFGALAIKRKEYGKVLYCFTELVQQMETHVEAQLRIGECYQAQGKMDKAKIWFDRALLCDAFHADAYYCQAKWFELEGELQTAIHQVKKALDLDADREEFYVLLGTLYAKIGRPVLSLRCFKNAVDLAPDDHQCWEGLLSHYFSSGSYRQTLKLVKEAMVYSPEPSLIFCKAACLMRMGNRDKGLRSIKDAVKDGIEHELLFSWAPELRSDTDVCRLFRL